MKFVEHSITNFFLKHNIIAKLQQTKKIAMQIQFSPTIILIDVLSSSFSFSVIPHYLVLLNVAIDLHSYAHFKKYFIYISYPFLLLIIIVDVFVGVF